MPKAIDVRLEASIDAVMSVEADIEAFCDAHELSPRTNFILTLVLEELLTNIVNHGYGGADGDPITLRIAREGDAVTGEVIDSGPLFDPTGLPDPDVNAALEDRDIGGLGVFLSRKFTRELTYTRVGDTNVVRFSIADDTPPPKEETP